MSTQPDEKVKDPPVFRVDHVDFKKPRMVEARNQRAARATCAKEFQVRKINNREIFDLAQEGVEMLVAGKRGGAS